jgi:hypothetical protein
VNWSFLIKLRSDGSLSSNRGQWFAWSWHALIAVFYAALVGFIFSPWLRPFHQPQRGGPELSIRAGDLTPLFSVWTQVTAHSLFGHGEWPLWSDHIYCGEPFFAKPQIGVISLTTLLCSILPAQVVATWTFLLHLWIAGLAMYGWCLFVLRVTTLQVVGLSAAPAVHAGAPSIHLPAACGGICFMVSAIMIEHTIIGHGPIVLVACFTPLVLWFLHWSFVSQHRVRLATLAGTLLAIQLLAGGETMFLHNAMAGLIVSVAWIAFDRGVTAALQGSRGWRARSLRVIAVSSLVGLVGFGLSAVKVLPGLELMAVSNRAGGLSLQDAAGFVQEFTEPVLFRIPVGGLSEFGDWRHVLPATMLLAAIGLVVGLLKRATRWLAVAGLLLILSGIAIGHSQFIFGLLWQIMPMFRFQRIPQRGLVLAYLGLSLLVSVGAQGVMVRFRNYTSVCVGILLLLWLAGESWLALPPIPPTADIRQEIAENNILNHIARQPGLFRIHAIESNDRNWGIEHVTVPLGLSNLVGWDHLWLLEYLGAEGVVGRDVRPFLTASYDARNPARFWGMMNVQFITATRRINVPGLQLAGEFTVSPRCQPRKSAGPYLYENVECMPRAWLVQHAILVLGDRADRQEAAYQLLDHPDFDPRRMVVIHWDDRKRLAPDELSHYRAVSIPESWATAWQRHPEFAHTKLLFYDSETSSRSHMFRWARPDEVTRLLNELNETASESEQNSSGDKAYVLADFRISHSGHARISLPARAGFLVLAEKIAHFPGWTAASDSGAHTLLKANGVATAIRLDGRESTIEFKYRPTGLAIGLWITVTSLLLVPLISWRGDKLLPEFIGERPA